MQKISKSSLNQPDVAIYFDGLINQQLADFINKKGQKFSFLSPEVSFLEIFSNSKTGKTGREWV